MTKKASPEPWLSIDDIAKYLSVKPDTIYKWINRKDFPAHKAGKLWRFRTSEVDNWVKNKNKSEDNTKQ